MKSVRLRAFQYIGLVAIAAVATLRGCDCSKDTFRQIVYSCEASGGRPGPDIESLCGPSKRFVKGACEEIRCDAGVNPPGCCPGMFCSGGGLCELPVRWVQYCDNDGQCDEGQECDEHPLLDPTPGAKTCRFPGVNLAGVCDNGGVPFNGRCVRKAPCGGACAPGQVCNVDVTRVVLDLPQGGDCEDPPSLPNVGHGCDQTCGEAEILVYADPDQMLFDQCCVVTCLCHTLPPLLSGPWGRFSSLAVGPSNLFVSAYDGFYGDLVLGAHSKISSQLESLDYVDGVPIGGSVVADPAGPRGGHNGPGLDVGKYTAIALHNGEPRIAYYDVDGNRRKAPDVTGIDAGQAAPVVDQGDRPGVESSVVGGELQISTLDVVVGDARLAVVQGDGGVNAYVRARSVVATAWSGRIADDRAADRDAVDVVEALELAGELAVDSHDEVTVESVVGRHEQVARS
ncbi:MAG: hypothetical protein V3T05_10395, partial [Myxococcota bacterium]